MGLIDLILKCCNWNSEKQQDVTVIDIIQAPEDIVWKKERQNTFNEKEEEGSASHHSIYDIKIEPKYEQQLLKKPKKTQKQKYPVINLISAEVSSEPVVLFESLEKIKIKSHKKRKKARFVSNKENKRRNTGSSDTTM